MKVVKLNRRFKQFKEHGHVVAMRFDQHCIQAMAYEKACREKLKGYGHFRGDPWCSYFGSKSSTRSLHYQPRTYWITFRNEADLTLVLLSADLT
jgi:hypothetical protein